MGPPVRVMAASSRRAARRLEQAAQRGADGYPQVSGPGHRAAADGHRPVGQRLAGEQGVADGVHGGYVKDRAAHIQGGLSRRHLPAGDGADELLFHP